MRAFALALREFLDRCEVDCDFAADTHGEPELYSEFLPGRRVCTANVVDAECRLLPDRWLELRARPAELDQLSRNIQKLKNGGHTHLYSSPVSLIFQADDSYPGFDEG